MKKDLADYLFINASGELIFRGYKVSKIREAILKGLLCDDVQYIMFL